MASPRPAPRWASAVAYGSKRGGRCVSGTVGPGAETSRRSGGPFRGARRERDDRAEVRSLPGPGAGGVEEEAHDLLAAGHLRADEVPELPRLAGGAAGGPRGARRRRPGRRRTWKGPPDVSPPSSCGWPVRKTSRSTGSVARKPAAPSTTR